MTPYTLYNVSEKQNEKGYLRKIRSSNKSCKTRVIKSYTHISDVKHRLKQLTICPSEKILCETGHVGLWCVILFVLKLCSPEFHTLKIPPGIGPNWHLLDVRKAEAQGLLLLFGGHWMRYCEEQNSLVPSPY